MRTTSAVLLLVVALAGCSSGASQGPPPTGYVLPTVAGRRASTFDDGAEARQAFTRRAGSLMATLEDAAWLKYLGNAEEVAQTHRSYFDYGYTTFQVETYSKDFVQPTKETFVLEDSCGARLTGSPTTYEGCPQLVEGRYHTTFSLSFRHTLTKDVRWIRLSWPQCRDGSTLEWRFDEPPCPPGQAPTR